MSDIATTLGLRPEHFRKEDGTTALLVYLMGLMGILLVNNDEKRKNNPYIKFHGTQAIGFMLVAVLLSLVTCGFFGIVYLPIAFYYGAKASKGEVFAIPVVTDFMLKRGYFDEVKALASAAPPAQLPPM